MLSRWIPEHNTSGFSGRFSLKSAELSRDISDPTRVIGTATLRYANDAQVTGQADTLLAVSARVAGGPGDWALEDLRSCRCC